MGSSTGLLKHDPVLNFAVEPWDQFWQDGAQLAYNAYAEVGENFPFDPDVSGYANLYSSGRLIALTVRDDGVMVGYLIFVLTQHFHARTKKVALEEGLYLKPEYRRGRVGNMMLNFAELVLASLGVQTVYYTSRPARPLDKLFKRRGMVMVASLWSKELPNG